MEVNPLTPGRIIFNKAGQQGCVVEDNYTIVKVRLPSGAIQKWCRYWIEDKYMFNSIDDSEEIKLMRHGQI